MAVPKLRFPGFEGEWEELILGEVSDVRDGTHDSPKYVEEGYPLITSKNLNKDGTLNFENVSYLKKEDFDKINQRSKVDTNDILFGMIGTIGNPVKVKESNFAIKNVALIKDGELLSNDYLIHYLNSPTIARQFYNENKGGTQKFIALGNIRKLSIGKPNNLIEEQKITRFFITLNEKIQLQQEKLVLLKEQKKGYMQKIFSQELRFKDENGQEFPAWGVKKIGEFIEDHKELSVIENQYPILTSSRNGLVLQSEHFKTQVTTNNNIGYHIIPKGYFTFRSRSDDGNFTFNINNIIEKGIVSYFYPVFKVINMNPVYFHYYLNNYLKKEINKEIVGTSQLVLSLNKLKDLTITTPANDEQVKIANLISNFDKKITLELDNLKELLIQKQAFMQQMFI